MIFDHLKKKHRVVGYGKHMAAIAQRLGWGGMEAYCYKILLLQMWCYSIIWRQTGKFKDIHYKPESSHTHTHVRTHNLRVITNEPQKG